MIPYELILTSASRPHLLGPTLESLLRRVDHLPERVLVHDDAVFPGHRADIEEAIMLAYQNVFGTTVNDWPETVLSYADPPRRLGPAVAWLLGHVRTPYVLYSQDDFVAVRAIPIRRALTVMDWYQLHHIRFNKRATMAFKETWAGIWEKEERQFDDVTLTVSDHWYFQTSLWRVAEINRAIVYWLARLSRFTTEEPETLINHYFDHGVYGGDPLNVKTRAACQKTFIWGGIGEDRFVRHIGGDPVNWAGTHQRTGMVDSAAQAWAEIHSYPGPHPVSGQHEER